MTYSAKFSNLSRTPSISSSPFSKTVPCDVSEVSSEASAKGRYGRVDEVELLQMVKGQSVNDLIDAMRDRFQVAESTARDNLALAEAGGVIQRVRHPDDGRKRICMLTAQGKKLLHDCLARFPKGSAVNEVTSYRARQRALRKNA